MTLRPVDLQVMLPKVSEVNRVQQVQNQQEQVLQQQIAAELQKTSEKRQQQVQHLDRSEQGKVEREKEGRAASFRDDREEKNKKQEQSPEEEENNEAKDPKRGNLLDIKI